MYINELLAVGISIVVAIGAGIAVFIGNTKDKITVKMVLMMIVIGFTSGIIAWTYMKDGTPTKILMRGIMLVTIVFTIFTKLVGRIINGLTSISEKDIQKIGLDYARKKLGLNETEDISDDVPSSDSVVGGNVGD